MSLFIQEYLSLFRNLMKASDICFPNLLAQEFVKNRIRLEFRKHRDTRSPARIQKNLQWGHSVLVGMVNEIENNDYTLKNSV